MNILVVDDERAICEILKEFLSIFGHTVHSAISGEEALERLKEKSFDVIFLDIRMHGISGLEVLKEVKASRPATKVIMISAYGDDETAQRAKELGADGYVQKPVDLPGLFLLLKDGGRP